MSEPTTPTLLDVVEGNSVPPKTDDTQSMLIPSEPEPGPQDDASILAELSLDTVGGQPWGILHFRLIHGQKVTNIAIRYKAVDIWNLSATIEDLGEESLARILKLTSATRSVLYTDETWLQSLACAVLGLDKPHMLRALNGTIVWNPANIKQCDLAKGMVALCDIGFTCAQIQELANGVSALTSTRQQDESEALGNS